MLRRSVNGCPGRASSMHWRKPCVPKCRCRSDRRERVASTGLRISICDDLERAVADIVSCATLATTPVVPGTWPRAGTHVDLVGAFKANIRETDDELMRRS